MNTLGPDTKIKLGTVAVFLGPLLAAAWWVYGVNEAVRVLPDLQKDVSEIKIMMIQRKKNKVYDDFASVITPVDKRSNTKEN
jgi:hypothetical protein